ncbi:gliding motility-associated C-terminal domain-containing protein [Cryomorpha ignava]|uniref:Gliding motility-associated C-terminal domain-containing protein n=1 Tax=Cryomorpha ignava TaxID=101383 RepID=A0A7K3WTG0_9FLAO|nr:gliding motility-associated C-terminal domain-containing protein [Cryomorpha ignava]NEN24172.1 gliding motility-associated C-terminal domain-containing protein [Cryomorpha ignava]
MIKWITIILALSFSYQLKAEHITGGDFSIQHVDGNTFEGLLTLYRDCNSSGAELDQNVIITVRDLLTDEHFTDLDFTFIGFTDYEAELGNSCFVPDICLQVGNYSAVFTLPDNPNGYYLTKERCCRNNASNNLAGFNLGFVFTVDVPDPALENSSPLFNPFPTDAYFCINGNNFIDFGAFDADDDSLVYSLTEPLRGSTDDFNANPAIASAKPFAQVPWAAGFSTDNQVGGAVPMTINPVTGLVTAQPTQLGIFTVAVKVEEYRDGIKIGEIRRELQLASTICAMDMPSEITTPNNDTIFDVYANTVFCIDITATDPNLGDTLFLEAGGELFDGSVEPGALFPPVDSFSTVTGEFCWSPICTNVQDEPYLVTFTAFSRGCANEVLVTTQDIYINVILAVDEPTQLAQPSTPNGPGAAIIDLYDPSTHCFDFQFIDPNIADSLNVIASSDLFLRDEVTIEPFGNDQGQISLPFCWDVACADVRDEPYFVDFQVVATNCEVNDTTTFSVPIFVIVQDDEPTVFAQPAQQIYFEFYSASSLSIPIIVTDANYFDTLNVTASSPIFSLPRSAATISDSLFGNSIVQGQIDWTPSCRDVRPEPYVITFQATANSCKTAKVVDYTVEIFLTLPPENSASISMPSDGAYYEYYIGDEPVDIDVLGSDPDPYDTLLLQYAGSVNSALQTSPTFETQGITETSVGKFTWAPACADVLDTPYEVVFALLSSSCQKLNAVSVSVNILVTTPTKGIIEPIANIITPNGDGRNDMWTIENKDDPCLLGFKAMVWDRWGKEVFTTQDPAFVWPGTYGNDSEAKTGTYFQTIEFIYKETKESFTGTIEVMK